MTKPWVALALALFVLAGAACHSDDGVSTTATRWSQITDVIVDHREELGGFAGVGFERLVGRVEGRVHRSEDVAGLTELLGPNEFHTYRSEFEIMRPFSAPDPHVVVVEVENRGSPIMLQIFNRFAIGFSGPPSKSTYPAGVGDGFLFAGGRSYARVQWETGVSPGVPPTAQGVGEVIVRDFGRLLRSGRVRTAASPLGRYRTPVLTGTSVSGWFINTFLAEGFNADPTGGRVYDGALILAGSGNWLAINRFAADGDPQQPYVRQHGRPLPVSDILTRPATDPFLVDVVTYPEFYRMRAALSRDADPPDRTRRYELPAPKAGSFLLDEKFVFDKLGCNNRRIVPLNPLDYRPYLRALLVGLEAELGRSDRRLPGSTLFELGPEPSPSPYFNDLPGADVPVPALDSDGQPHGGVRFPEVDLPLGQPDPPALPPVATTTNICGNIGGYRPFPAAELQRRYGTTEDYQRQTQPVIDDLVRRGFLLPSDHQWIADELRHRFGAAPTEVPAP